MYVWCRLRKVLSFLHGSRDLFLEIAGRLGQSMTNHDASETDDIEPWLLDGVDVKTRW